LVCSIAKNHPTSGRNLAWGWVCGLYKGFQLKVVNPYLIPYLSLV
jgi:hypothetical protein